MQTITVNRSHVAGSHPHFILTCVDGHQRVMFWNGEFWEVTQECRQINDLLDEGLISDAVAQSWVLLQSTSLQLSSDAA